MYSSQHNVYVCPTSLNIQKKDKMWNIKTFLEGTAIIMNTQSFSTIFLNVIIVYCLTL